MCDDDELQRMDTDDMNTNRSSTALCNSSMSPSSRVLVITVEYQRRKLHYRHQCVFLLSVHHVQPADHLCRVRLRAP